MPKINKKIAFLKCKRCRHDRQKCLPKDRAWPGVSCDRCQKYGYECSANRSTAQGTAIQNDNPESVPANAPIQELDLGVETTTEIDYGDFVMNHTPIEDLSSSALLQQYYDLHWLMRRLRDHDFLPYGEFTRELPGLESIIVSLSAERESILNARDVEVPNPFTLALQIYKFEKKIVAFWHEELKDSLISRTHLKNWIGDCHKRRDAYAERYGFSVAMNVQYRLVEQLSQSEYYGTPEMLSTEAATLVEMYQGFIDHCRSLHPSLQDPALVFLVVELAKREAIIKLKDFCEVAVIRTLFTQLAKPWQRLAVDYAITRGCVHAIEAYLDTGFDVNQQMESGISILHLAIKEGLKDTVLLLIEKGADVFAIDPRNGWNSLHYAACYTRRSDGNLLRALLDTAPRELLLLANNRNETALNLAQKYGEQKDIELIQDAMARASVV